MIDYRLKPGTLHQYYALIPYGSTLAECIRDDTHRTNLMNSPGVMILGRRGKLLNLNMVAALIVEEIIKGKNSEEILETLIQNFAQNINQAMEIQQDYLKITKCLEQAGYIECR